MRSRLQRSGRLSESQRRPRVGHRTAGTLRLYLETPRRTLENRQQHQRMELVNGKKPDTLERPRPAHPGLQCLHSSRSGGRILPDDGFI